MSTAMSKTDRSAKHATFTIERVYDATPARVFAAFADPKAKAKWFAAPPDWTETEQKFEFRIGGREYSAARDNTGVKHVFNSIYYDIVPDARIIYAYDMHLNDARISVSLTTIDIKAEQGGGKTKLTFTEQGVYLDGHDKPESREEGTKWLLDNLGKTL